MTETKIVKLYNWSVELVFYPNSHQYKINKETVYGVTGILGQLKQERAMPWVAKEALKAIEKAIEEGDLSPDRLRECPHAWRVKSKEWLDTWSQVHDWIELWIARKAEGGELPAMPEDPKVANGIISFLEWVKKHEVQFLKSEQFVYSKQYNYCGKFDAIALVDWVETLIDFKTSNSFYAFEFSIQVSAYKQAYEEEHGVAIPKMLGLHLNKETGEFESFDLTELYEEGIATFNVLAHLRQVQKVLDKKVNTLYPRK